MSPSQPALRFSAEPHLHVAGERCPYCDQPIPNEKAEEIRTRTEAKEREQADALTARLSGEFARERAKIEAAAREAGEKTAQAKTQERIAALERANAALQTAMQEQVADALRQKKAAVSQYETLKADHENVVSARVREAREAVEKDKINAVNAANAKHFEETQKLTDKLENFKRQLERKTNEELGEGAEVDLFEALKAEFEDDRIERIGRGAPGADIRHVVIHNGKECGTILYDSKNRGAWRNDYVDKLARDQSAAEAEHAILSTLKLPGQTRQVHVDKGTGIIVANPARVLALAQMVRRHLV
ncbi:MAG: DUF2130 domain-containing protein, partial [Geminicoccaceae bacterium]